MANLECARRGLVSDHLGRGPPFWNRTMQLSTVSNDYSQNVNFFFFFP